MILSALILLTLASAPTDAGPSAPLPAQAAAPKSASSQLRGDQGRKSAIKIADSWLKLVDSDQFGAAWEQSATWFKTGLRKDLWERNGASVRRPLGKLVKRELTASRVADSVPGSPQGTYWVLSYQSKFEKKSSVAEEVTLVDEKGKLRVVGYFIR
ncbi:MAG TPA: DUF4019 domain-containing protein [Myxococcaceae bacterium]|nr:DUF4019 domain-containing protein [Myxococcaceae bacterium]